MNHISIQQSTIKRIDHGGTFAGIDESALEQTIGISLLGDFNAQLTQIADGVRENLDQRRVIRGEITGLNSLASRQTVWTPYGEEAVNITHEEYNALIKEGHEGLQYQIMDDRSGYLLKKKGLTELIESKGERLAGLNSDNELTVLQIQSLIDQRKQALTLLSNLMASKNESLMTIIRNIKN